MRIKKIITSFSLAFFLTLFCQEIGSAEEENTQAKLDSNSSLADKLEVEDQEVKSLPKAQLQAPKWDTSFWDLSSDPDAKVTLPTDLPKLPGAGSDLE